MWDEERKSVKILSKDLASRAERAIVNSRLQNELCPEVFPGS